MNKNWILGLIILIILVLAGFLFFQKKEPVSNGDSEETQEQTRSVMLYFYNQQKDAELGNGNPACSDDSVEPVLRTIPVTQTPIQDTIRKLLQGQLALEERQQGLTTEFPLDGFSLKGTNLQNGKLTLEFVDLNNKTTGGSCRVRLLWAQIAKTALQFEEVDEVTFIPEELFQP